MTVLSGEVSDTEASFILAIREEATDDFPRLVFADWLTDHADSAHPEAGLDRAELIRVQCALAGANLFAGPSDLAGREQELLRRHGKSWRRGVDPHATFTRGFIEEATLGIGHAVEAGDSIFRANPIHHLTLSPYGVDGDALKRLPACAWLTHLRTLEVPCPNRAGLLRDLFDSPTLTNLRHLVLRRGDGVPGEREARLLARSPLLPRLESLDLSSATLGPDGLMELLDAPGVRLRRLRLNGRAVLHPPALRPLNETYPNVGPLGVQLLAQHPAAGHLRELHLAWNHLTPTCVRALTESPLLGGLEQLVLGEVVRHDFREQCRPLADAFGDRLQIHLQSC